MPNILDKFSSNQIYWTRIVLSCLWFHSILDYPWTLCIYLIHVLDLWKINITIFWLEKRSSNHILWSTITMMIQIISKWKMISYSTHIIHHHIYSILVVAFLMILLIINNDIIAIMMTKIIWTFLSSTCMMSFCVHYLKNLPMKWMLFDLKSVKSLLGWDDFFFCHKRCNGNLAKIEIIPMGDVHMARFR